MGGTLIINALCDEWCDGGIFLSEQWDFLYPCTNFIYADDLCGWVTKHKQLNSIDSEYPNYPHPRHIIHDGTSGAAVCYFLAALCQFIPQETTILAGLCDKADIMIVWNMLTVRDELRQDSNYYSKHGSLSMWFVMNDFTREGYLLANVGCNVCKFYHCSERKRQRQRKGPPLWFSFTTLIKLTWYESNNTFAVLIHIME